MARKRARILAVIVSIAVVLPVLPAGSIPPLRGPCDLTRGKDERIQSFSRRLIRCAVTAWPVPGGAEKALCIAARESGLDPKAQSRRGRYLGLYQHSARLWPDRFDRWSEPEWELRPSALNGRSNAIVTIRMVNASSWGPWRGEGCGMRRSRHPSA
jgi:hypothetical protein